MSQYWMYDLETQHAMADEPAETPYYVVELGDWPGGTLTLVDCAYPDAPDGGGDIALPVQCQDHARTVYWCLNAGVLWCDSGPPDYEVHRWPTG